MNIFLRELKANFKSLVIWGVVVSLFVFVGISKFSAYEGNPEMLKLLDNMPPALMDAFNMQAFNLTTLAGFFGVMFTYFALLLSIAAAMWGSDIISKEERDKTVEFSLVLPVTRSRVLTAKALAALVNCIALLLITWGVSLAAAAQYQPDGVFYRFLLLCMAALFFLQLIFLAVGLLLGCAMKQYRRTGAAAIAILLGSYFLSILSGMHDNLDFLKYLTPFKYFDPALLLHESKFEPVYLALTALIVIACMAGAYYAYAHRDLYV
jgi:ABC-2 type transport system permease protein